MGSRQVVEPIGVDGELRLNGHVGVYAAVGAGGLGEAVAPLHEVVARIGHSGYSGAMVALWNKLRGLSADATSGGGGVGELE